MTDPVLLGDEAVALGAIHAGLTAAYAYPGTPSTEILEFLLEHPNRSLPHHMLVDSEHLARQPGSARATNMVLIGAAYHFLPIEFERLEESIKSLFADKGEKVVGINLKAFKAGRGAEQ